jgi:hypothetical protein
MKKIFSFNSLILIILATILFVSCEKSDDKPSITAKNLKGMFIVCEGNFGTAEGDITYYNTVAKTSIKSLYYTVNNVEIGDIVQSFAIADTLGFIVVNNSQKVTVVNMKDFTTIKTITGFSYPRSIARVDDNTMYVSNGSGSSDNYIYSIDLTTLEKSDSLEITSGPEVITVVGSKVYAAISGGFNSNGNTVIEIDPETFTIAKTYTVASCPVDIVADKDENIWVYCKGVPDYSNYPDISYTGMGISKINAATSNVSTLSFASMSSPGINNITASADGSTVYFLNDGLYSMSSSATSLPTASLVSQSFYGVDVDPESGNIICLDAVNSKAVAFNTSGVEQYNFATGHFPNSAVFSY